MIEHPTSPNLRAGIARLADPKISLASFAGMLLGVSAAAMDGPVSWSWFAVTFAGVFAVEIAKNASGEVYDFDSGADLAVGDADRSPFSGGKRVLVDGVLTRWQTWSIAWGGYLMAIAIGLLIAALREPRVLWLGIAGMALAFFYHAPPLRLSYRGLGELAVTVCYGPLIVGGVYLVQRASLPTNVVSLSLPLGLLIAAFLWINEFPDYAADQKAGKRNLVVCVGKVAASKTLVAIVVAAFIVLALLPLFGLPLTVWIGAVAAIPAMSAVVTTVRYPNDTKRVISAQRRMLITFLLFSVGCSLGLALGG